MKRFADDPQALPGLRAMIDAARTDKPTAATLARVLARVEGGAPPSSGPGATRPALLAGGVGIAVIVAIAIAVWPAGRTAPATRAVPPSDPAPVARSVPPPPSVPEAASAPPAGPTPEAASTPPAPSSPHVPAPGRSKRRDPPATPPALEPAAQPSEVTLVERARSALVHDDPSTALATADEHASRYPDGILVEEREAIAIEALAGTGQLEDARARLARFIRRFPASGYRRHLEHLIGP